LKSNLIRDVVRGARKAVYGSAGRHAGKGLAYSAFVRWGLSFFSVSLFGNMSICVVKQPCC